MHTGHGLTEFFLNSLQHGLLRHHHVYFDRGVLEFVDDEDVPVGELYLSGQPSPTLVSFFLYGLRHMSLGYDMKTQVWTASTDDYDYPEGYPNQGSQPRRVTITASGTAGLLVEASMFAVDALTIKLAERARLRWGGTPRTISSQDQWVIGHFRQVQAAFFGSSEVLPVGDDDES